VKCAADGNLISVLHAKFNEGLESYTNEHHPFKAFISSGELVLRYDLYMPLSVLVHQYNDFVSRRRGTMCRTSVDRFLLIHSATLQRLNLVVREGTSIHVEVVSEKVRRAMFAKRSGKDVTKKGVIYPIQQHCESRYLRRSKGVFVFGCNVFDDVPEQPVDDEQGYAGLYSANAAAQSNA